MRKEPFPINIHICNREEYKNGESKGSAKNSTEKTGDTFTAAVEETTGSSLKVSGESIKTAGETF
ncbi:MAG: hypothetical protein KJO26_06190 [Deltaproteobacteria bacterium]|nr:hypothetical protein [Deltaproteobacteria bacterium]